MFRLHSRRVTFVSSSSGAADGFRLLEPVAHPPDRLDAGERRPSGRELGPEPRHVHVHGPGLDETVLPPDDVEELFPAEHAPGSPNHGRQQFELLWGQSYALASHRHLESVAIDLEVARPEVMLALGCFRGLAAPHHGPDTRDQLPRGERLGHVVVGSHLEAQDFVAFVHTTRHHDHRQVAGLGILLEPAADFPAVELGNHDVEQDDFGLGLASAPDELSRAPPDPAQSMPGAVPRSLRYDSIDPSDGRDRAPSKDPIWTPRLSLLRFGRVLQSTARRQRGTCSMDRRTFLKASVGTAAAAG